MKPIKFAEMNCVYAENQDDYLNLPARVDDGTITSCWKMSFWEVFKLFWTGKLWVQTLSFGDPLQPILLTVHSPFEYGREENDD